MSLIKRTKNGTTIANQLRKGKPLQFIGIHLFFDDVPMNQINNQSWQLFSNYYLSVIHLKQEMRERMCSDPSAYHTFDYTYDPIEDFLSLHIPQDYFVPRGRNAKLVFCVRDDMGHIYPYVMIGARVVKADSVFTVDQVKHRSSRSELCDTDDIIDISEPVSQNH